MAAAGGGLGAAAGLAGLGLPGMGGFNGLMNAGYSLFGQTTPAYDFVPSWLTANWNSPSTTPLPQNNDVNAAATPSTTDVTKNTTNDDTPTPAPTPRPPSGSGGTRGPWDNDAAWNNGGGGGHNGGQSGGGGCNLFRAYRICLSLSSDEHSGAKCPS